MRGRFAFAIALLSIAGSSLRADPPALSYLFPAGGQRGTTVRILAGGLALNDSCHFEILGPGVKGPAIAKRADSPIFEGPLLPIPESQRQEDYPRAMAAEIKIDANAQLGHRHVRMWTSQGVTLPMPFVVGDLPELIEQEIPGEPIPVSVKAPTTINGRIYPREDVDVWTVMLKKGESLTASVAAGSLGSPLETKLIAVDPNGRTIDESDAGLRGDTALRFIASQDGEYRIHISDTRGDGGPAHVYRLTLTTGPWVDRVFPLGGRRGEKLKLQLNGQQVPNETIEVAIPKDTSESFATRWESSNSFRLDVDDLPEFREGEAFTVPGIGNGIILKANEVDAWKFAAKKGETFDVDLRAFRLGSPLLGVIEVRDGAGKVLGSSEAAASDPSLKFTTPADGDFTITVRDKFSLRGGPSFAYRLRVDRASSDFTLQASLASLTIPRNGQAKLQIIANKRSGLNAPIKLTVEGLPAGVTLAKETAIAPNQANADIVLKADAAAKIDSFLLKITGTAGTTTRTAKIIVGESELDQVRASVALPTPFKIAGDYVLQLVPRGTAYSRKYRIERNGFDGPITVDLADRQARHLQGVTGEKITVPAGANEFEYFIDLPPWMETGRTCRVCVMGTAIVKEPDGREHVVTYSSKEQNDQIIAVVEPERLGLKLDRQTVRVEPGTEVEVGFSVSRGEKLGGPATVSVEVPAHFHGLSVEKVELPANASDGRLKLRFAKDAKGPFNMPLLMKAIIVEDRHAVTAEAQLELVGSR